MDSYEETEDPYSNDSFQMFNFNFTGMENYNSFMSFYSNHSNTHGLILGMPAPILYQETSLIDISALLFNNSSNSTNMTYVDHIDLNSPIINISQLVIIGLGLLVTLLAIFAVFSLVKKGQTTSVFIINLLISDLLQLCSLIPQFVQKSDRIFIYIYLIGMMASVGFMVCVSMERYLVIAWPLWYRFKRNIKTSLVICVIVWAVPLIFIPTVYFNVDFSITSVIMAVFLLIPFPLLIFFLVGSLRALSAVISVPADEKRRIVAILVLVLLIYTLLFFPLIIGLLVKQTLNNDIFLIVVSISAFVSPLADSIMYILLKKSVFDKAFASLCCKILNNQQIESVKNSRLQDVNKAVPSIKTV